MGGTEEEISQFGEWLGTLAHPHKIVVAGNHDFLFEYDPRTARRLLPDDVTYLCDSAASIDGLRFWGSPWQPWYFDWAFNLQRGPEIRAKWDLIPDDIDILVTHGPPAGIGDVTHSGESVGCVDLLAAIERVRPQLAVCGHIHESYGVHGSLVNAAICDVHYRPVNRPIVVDLDGR